MRTIPTGACLVVLDGPVVPRNGVTGCSLSTADSSSAYFDADRLLRALIASKMSPGVSVVGSTATAGKNKRGGGSRGKGRRVSNAPGETLTLFDVHGGG